MNRRGFLRALAGGAVAAAAAPAIVPKLTVGVDMAAGESVSAAAYLHARYGFGFFVKTTAGARDLWIRDWYIAGTSRQLDALEKLVRAQWEADLKDLDRTLFGAAPEKASTASNAVLEPHQVCTLETLTEARRQLRMAEADAELDVLLSDDWPIYSAVKRGARHCRVDGRDYLVEVPKTWA